MQTSLEGLRALEAREGCVLHAYRDSVGVWTIGVGHTGPDVSPDLVWTQAQADEAFRVNVKEREDCINAAVSVLLTQNQFDALVSFVFNVGIGAFQRSTMLRLLNTGDYASAAQQFDAWHIPTEIVGRRNQEKAQFLSGTNATPLPTPDAPSPSLIQHTTQDVQRRLGVEVDGVYGPLTKAYVILFQLIHGLVPDGICGPRTMAALFSQDTQ